MHRGSNLNIALLRAWLSAVLLAFGFGLLAGPNSVGARGETRTLEFYEIHTKETLKVTYKKDGVYDKDALRKINHIMRDWRRNEPTNMDPELIDLIWELHTELGSKEPVHLISGYRSSKTNAKLRRRGGGQAKKSQHIMGKAADIHFPDIKVKDLRNSALIREVGGVGYYPRSGIPFVHVDTAGVRAWPRVPRQELAMLFPSGKTRHIPSDGRPLTAKDGRIALAKLQARGLTPYEYAHGGRKPAPVQVASVPAPTPKPERVEAPAAAPVQVASAPQQQAPEPATAPPARPKPILASLGPSDGNDVGKTIQRAAGFGLSWLTRLDEIAADLNSPESVERQQAATEPRMTASLGPAPAAGSAPPLYRTHSVPAPELDTEHPEELSYQPYSVLPLLAGADAARADGMTGLAHPEQEVGLRLMDAMGGAEARFDVRYSGGSAAVEQRFNGPAVSRKLAAVTGAEPNAPFSTASR